MRVVKREYALYQYNCKKQIYERLTGWHEDKTKIVREHTKLSNKYLKEMEKVSDKYDIEVVKYIMTDPVKYLCIGQRDVVSEISEVVLTQIN